MQKGSENIFICDKFIVKLNRDAEIYKINLKKEYDMYIYFQKNAPQYIYNMPIFYEDDKDCALVFDNIDHIDDNGKIHHIKTLRDIYMDEYINTEDEHKLDKFIAILKIVRDNIVDLNVNYNIYHNDSHLDNILYKDNHIYFIDLDSVTIGKRRSTVDDTYEEYVKYYDDIFGETTLEGKKDKISVVLR